MTWNYRILSKKHSQTGETFYGIHEVFYDSADKVWGCTQDPLTPMGETPEDLKAELQEYLEAFDDPVIAFESIPEEGSVNPVDGIDLENIETMEEAFGE